MGRERGRVRKKKKGGEGKRGLKEEELVYRRLRKRIDVRSRKKTV